jgi:hypothetical protein
MLGLGGKISRITKQQLIVLNTAIAVDEMADFVKMW